MNCPICSSEYTTSFKVPFSKNVLNIPCEDNREVEYVKCNFCNFIFCPEMSEWNLGVEVYNDEYVHFDPEYTGARSKDSAMMMLSVFNSGKGIKHLDYGSGMGKLSTILNNKGWNSTSYDPYSHSIKVEGKFNLITAFEVFEHSCDIDKTISDIKSMLDREGVILFSTLLADENTPQDWYYLAPRNGHISLLSKKSLLLLAKKHSLFFGNLNDNVHVLQVSRSSWKGLVNG